MTGVPRITMAPGGEPSPRTREAGATAGPDTARKTSAPPWSMSSPPEASRAPGVRGRPAHNTVWPTLISTTHTAGPI